MLCHVNRFSNPPNPLLVFLLIPVESAEKFLIPVTFGGTPPPRGRDGLTVDPTSAREIYGIKALCITSKQRPLRLSPDFSNLWKGHSVQS